LDSAERSGRKARHQGSKTLGQASNERRGTLPRSRYDVSVDHRMPPTRSTPSVTVIVLNFNGRRHLEVCLPSLEALDYPNATVMVADNGSTDGSLDYVRASHRRIRLAPMGANLGFSVAYNRAVPQADTDYIALLNNDTKVDPTWLTELVSAAERHGAAAAASAIVDWDGSRIDFVGGLPTAFGHCWQIDHGEPVGRDYPERRLLFGCGGSMLIRRDAFLDAGGFDEDFFAYFEDVDLGWRMNLLGHTTVLAPRARTYHRLHGTWGAWAHVLRLRLYERNALSMVFKNYGDEALGRILPAAVALTLERALAQAGLDADGYRFGYPPAAAADLPAPVIATLIALEDLALAMPSLLQKRHRIQSRRVIADSEILALFPEPLKLHESGDAYREAAEALIRDFRIAELFGVSSPPVRVAVRAAAGAPQTPDSPSDRPPRPSPSSNREPAVSVIVLTASGATHLPECLDSLRLHDWPADRIEVIVVDNGSADDPTAIAQRHYPGVRVVRTGANLGFAAGNNAGARVATGDYLVFLNDDTRVSPGWLRELMAVAVRRGAASVAALLLDWAGERVDFAGGLVNFEGRGYSLGYDRAVSEVTVDEQPLLFACGAAMLVDRQVFEQSGGWDESTFAYYEDVEFGWRLWLLGWEVWLAPGAVVYHRHHGTSGDFSPARVRAFERNALRMLYSLLDDEALQRVLPAALLLAADRALLGTPFSRTAEHDATGTWAAVRHRLRPRVAYIRLLHALSQRGARRQRGLIANLTHVGPRGLAGAVGDAFGDILRGWAQPDGRARYLIERNRAGHSAAITREPVPVAAAAALLGLHDFLQSLPELSRRRASIQARRKRTDAAIFDRFGEYWSNAVPSPHPDLHLDLRARVMRVLDPSLRQHGAGQ
jgi:GT2 family glycosyltransferase